MYEFNSNFSKFPGGYLFAVLHQKLDAYKKEHPEEKVISLGVGDVTLPLPKAVTDAMQKAVLEQTKKETLPEVINNPISSKRIFAIRFAACS